MKTAEYFIWICLNYFWNVCESRSVFIDRTWLSQSVLINDTDYNGKTDLLAFNHAPEVSVIPNHDFFITLVPTIVSLSCCAPNNTSWRNCLCVSENMEMVLEMENVSYNVMMTKRYESAYLFTNGCSYLGGSSHSDLRNVVISFDGGVPTVGAAYFKNDVVQFTAQAMRTKLLVRRCSGDNYTTATGGNVDEAHTNKRACIFVTPFVLSVEKVPSPNLLRDVYDDVQAYLEYMFGDHSPVIILHGTRNHADSRTSNRTERTYDMSSATCKEEIRLTQLLRFNGVENDNYTRQKRSGNFETNDYGFDRRINRINSARSRSGRLRHDDDDDDESQRRKGWGITYRTARTWTTSASTTKTTGGPAVWEILHTVPTTTATTTTTTTTKTTTAKPFVATTKTLSTNAGTGSLITKPKDHSTAKPGSKRISAGKTTAKVKGHVTRKKLSSLGGTPNLKFTGRSTPFGSKKHGATSHRTTIGPAEMHGPYGGAAGRTVHKPVPVIRKLQTATTKPTTREFVTLRSPHKPAASPLEVTTQPIDNDFTLKTHATVLPAAGQSQPPPWAIPAYMPPVGAPTLPMVVTKKPKNKHGYPVTSVAAENTPTHIHGSNRQHAGQIPPIHAPSFLTQKTFYMTPRPIRPVTSVLQIAEKSQVTPAGSPFVTSSYVGKGAEQSRSQVPNAYQIATTQSVPSWEIPRSVKPSKSGKEDRTEQYGSGPQAGAHEPVPETKGHPKETPVSRSKFPKRGQPNAEEDGERKQGASDRDRTEQHGSGNQAGARKTVPKTKGHSKEAPVSRSGFPRRGQPKAEEHGEKRQGTSVDRDRTEQYGSGHQAGPRKTVPKTKVRPEETQMNRSKFPRRGQSKTEENTERRQGTSANRGNINSPPVDKTKSRRDERRKPHSRSEKLAPVEKPSRKGGKSPTSLSNINEPKIKPNLRSTSKKQDLNVPASRKEKSGKHQTEPKERINPGKSGKISEFSGMLTRPSGSASSQELPSSSRRRHKKTEEGINPSRRNGKTHLSEREDYHPINKPRRTSDVLGSSEEPTRKGIKQSSKAGKATKLPSEHTVNGQASGRIGKTLAKVDEFGPVEEPHKSHARGLFGHGLNRQQPGEKPHAVTPVKTKTADDSNDEMAQIPPKPEKSAPFHGPLLPPLSGQTHLSRTSYGKNTDTNRREKAGTNIHMSTIPPTDIGEFGPAESEMPHHPSGIQKHFPFLKTGSEPSAKKKVAGRPNPDSENAETKTAKTNPPKGKVAVPHDERPLWPKHDERPLSPKHDERPLWPKNKNFHGAVHTESNSLPKQGTSSALATAKKNRKTSHNEPHSAAEPGSPTANTEETGLKVPQTGTLWPNSKSQSDLSKRKSSVGPASTQSKQNIPIEPKTINRKDTGHSHATQSNKKIPQVAQSAEEVVEPKHASPGHHGTLLNSMKPLWSASGYRGLGGGLPHGYSPGSADEHRKEEVQVPATGRSASSLPSHSGKQTGRKKEVIQNIHHPMSATEHGKSVSSSREKPIRENEEEEKPIYIGRRPSATSDDSTYRRLGFGSQGYRQLTPLLGHGQKKAESRKDTVLPRLIQSANQAVPYGGQATEKLSKSDHEPRSRFPQINKQNKPITTPSEESHPSRKSSTGNPRGTVELPSKYGTAFTARKGTGESAHPSGEFFHRRLWGEKMQSAFPLAPASTLEENRKFKRPEKGHETFPAHSDVEAHNRKASTAPRQPSAHEFAPVSGRVAGGGAAERSKLFPTLLGGSSTGRVVSPYEGGSTGVREMTKEILHQQPSTGGNNPSVIPTIHSSGRAGLSPSDSEDFTSLLGKARPGMTSSGEYLMPSLLEQGKRGGYFHQPYSSIDEFGPAEQLPSKAVEKFHPSNSNDHENAGSANAAGEMSNIFGESIGSGRKHLTPFSEISGSEESERPIHHYGREKGRTVTEVPLTVAPKSIWNHQPETIPEPVDHYEPVAEVFTKKPKKTETPHHEGQTGHFPSGLESEELPSAPPTKEIVQGSPMSWIHGRPLHSQFGEGHRYLTPLNEFGESVPEHPVVAIPPHHLPHAPEPSIPKLTTEEWVTPRPIHQARMTTQPHRSVVTKPKKLTTVLKALMPATKKLTTAVKAFKPATLSPGKPQRMGQHAEQRGKPGKSPVHTQQKALATAAAPMPARSAVPKTLKVAEPVTQRPKPITKPATSRPVLSVASVAVKPTKRIAHHVPTSAPKHVLQVTKPAHKATTAFHKQVTKPAHKATTAFHKQVTKPARKATTAFHKPVHAATSSSAQETVLHTVRTTSKMSNKVTKPAQVARNSKNPFFPPTRAKHPNFGPLPSDSGPMSHNQFTTPHTRRKKTNRNRKQKPGPTTHRTPKTHEARIMTAAGMPATMVPIRHGQEKPGSRVTAKPVHPYPPSRNRHNKVRERPVERTRSKEEDSLGPARENVHRGHKARESLRRESQREPESRRGPSSRKSHNERIEQPRSQRPMHEHRIEPPRSQQPMREQRIEPPSPNRPHEFSRAHRPHEFSAVKPHVPHPLPAQRPESHPFQPHGGEYLRGRPPPEHNANIPSGAESRGRHYNKFNNPNFAQGREFARPNGRPPGPAHGQQPQRSYNKFNNPRHFTRRPHWRFAMDTHQKSKREIDDAALSEFDCESVTHKDNLCTLVTLDRLGTFESVFEIAHSIIAVMHENEAKLFVNAANAA